jgi:hypothetical protein
MLIGWRFPWNIPDTIESKQAEFRTQPKVSVLRLSNCDDCTLGKTPADWPRRVCVLADVQRRVQRERARAPREQHARQHNAKRDSVSSSPVRSPHNTTHYLILSPGSRRMNTSNVLRVSGLKGLAEKPSMS